MKSITSYISNLSSKQWLIIGLVILIIILFIIAVNKSNKKTIETRTVIKDSNYTSSFPLKLGSRGDDVKTVQSKLNSKFNAGLSVDGVWGPLTDKAVSTYLGISEISQSYFINTITKL